MVDLGAAGRRPDPAVAAAVVAEEGERRAGQADQGPEALAAAAGQDGIPRAVVREQHVERRPGQGRQAPVPDAAPLGRPAAGVRCLVVDAPDGTHPQRAGQRLDPAVTDAADEP